MIQELFRVGPIAISPFGVMLVAAFAAGYWRLVWGFNRLGIGNSEDASSVVFAAGAGGILGAKVYYAILHGDWHLLLERSGLVWYGGFLLGAAAVFWTLRRRRLPLWPTLDAAAPGLALGYGIGRIGCFLVGDDYGRPTSLPWGVEFANGLPPTTAYYLRTEFGVAIPAGVPDQQLLAVHPTQIYETLAALVIFAVGTWLLARKAPTGRTLLAVVGLMSVERFAVEILRAKDDRFLGPMTIAQVISIVLVLVVAVLWRRTRSAGAAKGSLAVAGAGR
jgi:phosphatidylglycerol---prolipoprotein diacylglyceryl transferase